MHRVVRMHTTGAGKWSPCVASAGLSWPLVPTHGVLCAVHTRV